MKSFVKALILTTAPVLAAGTSLADIAGNGPVPQAPAAPATQPSTQPAAQPSPPPVEVIHGFRR